MTVLAYSTKDSLSFEHFYSDFMFIETYKLAYFWKLCLIIYLCINEVPLLNYFLHKNGQIWYQFGNSFLLFYEILQKKFHFTNCIFGVKN